MITTYDFLQKENCGESKKSVETRDLERERDRDEQMEQKGFLGQ